MIRLIILTFFIDKNLEVIPSFYTIFPKFLTREHMLLYGGIYGMLSYFGTLLIATLEKMITGDNFIYDAFDKFTNHSEPQMRALLLVLGIGGGSLITGYVGKMLLPYIGSLANKLRVKNMSDKVVDYRYGTDALNDIKDNLEQKELERDAIELFKSNGNDGVQFHEKLMKFLGKFARNSIKKA